MTSLLQDLRLALRLFSRQPGFAAVAVLVLGLGIGANTTMFSVVNQLILKPRPGAGEELVQLYSRDRTAPDSYRDFSYANFTDLRARTDLFAGLTAHKPGLVGITEGDSTRRAFIDITTGDLFRTFDLPLTMGRTFTAEEERPGAAVPVTILSHWLWMRLGAPAGILGQTIRINQRDHTIIGVAPEGFSGRVVMVTPELWLPLGVYERVVNDFAEDRVVGTLADRSHHALFVYGRLSDDVSPQTAESALDSISRGMEAAFPAANRDQQLGVGPVSRLSISSRPDQEAVGAVLGVSLLSMSGIVLLIASLNLANMQLARGSARSKEFAIRLALGSSRPRVVRQLLTEGLLLSAAGGALAVLIATGAMRVLVDGMTGLLPVLLVIDATPDIRVFAATMVFATVGTLLSSLGPALSSSRTDILPGLKDQAGELPVRRRSWVPMRHLLVMGQLALSLALLTTAGAFVQGSRVAADVDPGFSFDRGIHIGLDTGLAGFEQARAETVYAAVLDRIRQTPGVTRASLGSLMPFGPVSESLPVQRPGAAIRPSDPGYRSAVTSAVTQSVSDDYFPSLGLSLVRGRDFTATEVRSPGTPPVAIIDQRLATRVFGDEDPVGQLLQINRGADLPPETALVIGIAPPIRHQMEDAEPTPHLYRPLAQRFRNGLTLHAETTAPDEALLLPTLRNALRAVDPLLPVLDLDTGQTFRERNPMLWIVRAGAQLFTTFGVVALLMASLGIYGVKAYLVSRRTREIGIRLALGATAHDVISLVLRDGLALTVTGLIVGLGVSFVAVRGIGTLIYGGGGFDLPIVGAAFVVLTAAALAANLVPARRATRIAPSMAFRQQG